MSNRRRITWNGDVRALSLREQLGAAAIAPCEALSVTPSDYAWLKAMADDAGDRITHLDPFVRWVDQWRIYYPHLNGRFAPEAVFRDLARAVSLCPRAHAQAAGRGAAVERRRTP